MLTSTVEPFNDEISIDSVDIFEQALFTIFSDSRNQHGEPGQKIVYKSSQYGDLKLRLANPNPSDNGLFAHFLWNAGVQAAEIISNYEFDVKNQTVLELGAGAALPGILCCLHGANQTVISDYPAIELIENIEQNVKENLPGSLRPTVSVIGHEWGNLDDLLCSEWQGSFTRIIAADCMWMGHQHDNLCKSIVRLLSTNGVCLAIAGFHTGRAKVVSFFEAAKRLGLLPLKPIFERDVEGNERSWENNRGFEDQTERKKWLTIAFLGFPGTTLAI